MILCCNTYVLLKSMGYEPSGPFITSTLELKLDQATVFEWQKHSHKSVGVPHYQDLLDFLNLRAQATESTITDGSNKGLKHDTPYTRKGSLLEEWWHHMLPTLICLLVNVFCVNLISTHCMPVHDLKTCLKKQRSLLLSQMFFV